jgi:hypothetical protein
VAIGADKLDLGEIGQLEAGFAGEFSLLGQGARRARQYQANKYSGYQNQLMAHAYPRVLSIDFRTN